MEKKSLKERLLSKVQYANTGCWIWTGCVANKYGQIGSGEGKQRIRTHRASYMIFKGPIPEGMVIDHLCRNKLCINPNHLEVVTLKENAYRGESPTIKIHHSGYCARGHEINSINTSFHPRTGLIQHCRICERDKKHALKRGAI